MPGDLLLSVRTSAVLRQPGYFVPVPVSYLPPVCTPAGCLLVVRGPTVPRVHTGKPLGQCGTVPDCQCPGEDPGARLGVLTAPDLVCTLATSHGSIPGAIPCSATVAATPLWHSVSGTPLYTQHSHEHCSTSQCQCSRTVHLVCTESCVRTCDEPDAAAALSKPQFQLELSSTKRENSTLNSDDRRGHSTQAQWPLTGSVRDLSTDAHYHAHSCSLLLLKYSSSVHSRAKLTLVA
jgi:hypothetical protein